MINLMPDEAKRQLRAARANVLLLRYLLVLLIATGFIAFAIVGSFYLLTQTKASAEELIAASDTEAEVYSETQQAVAQLSSQLSEARSTLNNEVSYSNILINFGQLMPEGTVLDSITLDGDSFNGTPVTMTIYAVNTDAVVNARERFQSTSYFSNVSFQSISEGNTTVSGYPVSAQMTLTINRTIAQ
jgi:hypothetical protein